MNKIKTILTPVIASLLMAVGLMSTLPATLAYAAPAQDACDGIRAVGGRCNVNQNAASNRFGNIIKSVINILSIIVGAVSVIMIIIGGFRYVISGGDANATKGAKDTIMYAVIGLVVVIFAQIIIQFVFSQANEAVNPASTPATPGTPTPGSPTPGTPTPGTPTPGSPTPGSPTPTPGDS